MRSCQEVPSIPLIAWMLTAGRTPPILPQSPLLLVPPAATTPTPPTDCGSVCRLSIPTVVRSTSKRLHATHLKSQLCSSPTQKTGQRNSRQRIVVLKPERHFQNKTYKKSVAWSKRTLKQDILFFIFLLKVLLEITETFTQTSLHYLYVHVIFEHRTSPRDFSTFALENCVTACIAPSLGV